jgi:tRNA G18 (ribose-2'-O)-methylase SpoU
MSYQMASQGEKIGARSSRMGGNKGFLMKDQIRKLSFEEIRSSRPTIQELLKLKRLPVSVVLENIRSLYNVGSIFRTSDGVLAEKLYLCGYTGHPPSREIEKTALGSIGSVPWEHHSDSFEVVTGLRERGYLIVSLEHTNSSIPYTEAEYRFPLCLIVGNEVEGISDELLSITDVAIEIPMFGIKQSLNVSVAYGVVIYHIFNQFRR